MLTETPIDLDTLRRSADSACRLMKVLSNPDRLLLLCQLCLLYTSDAADE